MEAENSVGVPDVSPSPTADEEKIDQDEVPIDETTFPDEHFRNFVLEKIDRDWSGSLSPHEIAVTEEINCYHRQISDLTGIGYFTALEKLFCGDNQLKELDVHRNTELRMLECQDNQLTELNVGDNTALRILECKNNQLTELNLGKITGLESLCCYNNQLTKLDVSQMRQLEVLLCSNNQLTSLDLVNTMEDYPFTFAAKENSYNIQVDSNNRFDLSKLPGHFDVSKVKEGSWIGATVSGDILTVDQDVEKVTYTYKCGTIDADEKYDVEFTLNVTGHDASPVEPDIPADGGAAGGPADNIGGAISAVVVGAAAGAIIYEAGTGIYRVINMPGIAMPSDRIELAELLWEHAGKPESVSTALYSDIDEGDTDAQKAARWAVEQELMKDNGEKNTFNPHFPVSKLRTCLTWNAAKEKGLFDTDKTAE